MLSFTNLSFKVDWKCLKDHCRTHHIDVCRVDIEIDPKSGKSAGRAVVHIWDHREVKTAIRTLNGTILDNRPILVQEDCGDRQIGGKDEWHGGRHKVVRKGCDPWDGGNAFHKDQWQEGDRPYQWKSGEEKGWQDGSWAAAGHPWNRGRYGDGDGREPCGGRPGCFQGDQGADPRGLFRIIITNLPSPVRWQSVKDLCRNCGANPNYVRLGERGCATVELNSERDIDATQALDGFMFESRRLQVEVERGSRERAHRSRRDAPVRDSRSRSRSRRRWDGDVSGRRSGQHWDKQRGTHTLPWPQHPVPQPPPPHAPSKSQPGPSSSPALSTVPRSERSLFAENLAVGLGWKALKDHFRGRYKVLYADVVDCPEDNEAYGIIVFPKRQDALEACLHINGSLIQEKPIRLRRDNGDFDDLKALMADPDLKVRPSRARTPANELEEEEEPEVAVWEDEEPNVEVEDIRE